MPYNFSDLLAVNHLAGVQVKEMIYVDPAGASASATKAATAYSAFNRDSVNANPPVSGRWSIGSNWRATTGAIGVKTDRFYVVKDPAGNVYKLKFISFHPSDGGVRGYPVIEYKLVKQG